MVMLGHNTIGCHILDEKPPRPLGVEGLMVSKVLAAHLTHHLYGRSVDPLVNLSHSTTLKGDVMYIGRDKAHAYRPYKP